MCQLSLEKTAALAARKSFTEKKNCKRFCFVESARLPADQKQFFALICNSWSRAGPVRRWQLKQKNMALIDNPYSNMVSSTYQTLLHHSQMRAAEAGWTAGSAAAAAAACGSNSPQMEDVRVARVAPSQRSSSGGSSSSPSSQNLDQSPNAQQTQIYESGVGSSPEERNSKVMKIRTNKLAI